MSDDLTAREQLHREATWGLLQAGVDDASTAADRLIDAYAHELAQKIRQNSAHLRDSDSSTARSVWAIINAQADLIDPQVNT